MEIERVENESNLWDSPLAYQSVDESQDSTDRSSLYYFTATSTLSESSQSYWGMESTDGGTAVTEFEYICNIESGEGLEEKRDPQEVALQILDTLNKLEMELASTDDWDSYETQTCGSEESPWEQDRVHPTLNYKYKPINSFFERKSACTKNITQQVLKDEDLEANNQVVVEMQQSLTQFASNTQQENTSCTQRQLTLNGSCFGTSQLDLGKAMQQIELSRRGFYPRRDVIKWYGI
jgi:hypothetical protein